MNNTSLIDASLYSCYYVYESLDEFKLYIRYPDGDMEYTKYDLFTAGDKTIIAFKEYDVTKTEYNYVLVSGSKESIVQWAAYESLYFQINQRQVNTYDAYCILNSVSIPNLMTTDYDPLLSYETRCDTQSYGVMPYPLVDGEKPSTVDGSRFNGQTIKLAMPFLSVGGIFHIEYFIVKDMGTSYQDWPAVSGVAQTFMGAMKLVTEWASLADEPFSLNDEIMLDAKNFLETLELGQDIIDEISEYQEDMPVYRYLKNVDNARTGFNENNTISPLLSVWLRKKLRYESLNSLVAQYPEEINVDSNVLEQERIAIEESVYEYCTILQLDADVVTPEEVLNLVEYLNLFRSENLSHSDAIKAKKTLLSYMSYI